jgi:hypothetical protein
LPVELTMMYPAKWDCELVRNSASECTWLGIPNVVSLAGLPATDRARLNGNEPEMILVARATRRKTCDLSRRLVAGIALTVARCVIGTGRRRLQL